MIPASIALNPFALMMDPSRVIATMERSEQLRELRHHEYRPLDKPLIAHRSSRPLHDFDVVIEAAGTASALAHAAERCRPGGTIVLLGSYWDGSVEMPGMAIGMKELTLVPAVMYGRSGPSRDVDVAATILAQRPELPDVVITHRFPLDAAADAFAVAADRSTGAIKVVLEP